MLVSTSILTKRAAPPPDAHIDLGNVSGVSDAYVTLPESTVDSDGPNYGVLPTGSSMAGSDSACKQTYVAFLDR
jgi:hypothetical protein